MVDSRADREYEKLGECCHIDGIAVETRRYDLVLLDIPAIETIL